MKWIFLALVLGLVWVLVQPVWFWYTQGFWIAPSYGRLFLHLSGCLAGYVYWRQYDRIKKSAGFIEELRYLSERLARGSSIEAALARGLGPIRVLERSHSVGFLGWGFHKLEIVRLCGHHTIGDVVSLEGRIEKLRIRPLTDRDRANLR